MSLCQCRKRKMKIHLQVHTIFIQYCSVLVGHCRPTITTFKIKKLSCRCIIQYSSCNVGIKKKFNEWIFLDEYRYATPHITSPSVITLLPVLWHSMFLANDLLSKYILQLYFIYKHLLTIYKLYNINTASIYFIKLFALALHTCSLHHSIDYSIYCILSKQLSSLYWTVNLSNSQL